MMSEMEVVLLLPDLYFLRLLGLVGVPAPLLVVCEPSHLLVLIRDEDGEEDFSVSLTPPVSLDLRKMRLLSKLRIKPNGMK